MSQLKYTFSIIFFLFCFSAFTQENEKIGTRHQYGVSLNLNTNVSLTHRYAFSKEKKLRSTIKTRLNGRGIDVGVQRFFTSLSLGVGFESHFFTGKKLSGYYGGEIEYTYNLDLYISASNTINVSGITGLQYTANDLISFFTEVKYGVNFIGRYRGQIFDWLLSPTSEVNFGVLFKLGKMV